MAVLDPRSIDLPQIDSAFRKGDIPFLSAEQLSFGYLPNVRLLRPGDLVLISYLEPTIDTIFIESAQRRQFPDTAEWTHVAVYAGGWTLIEALPGIGVTTGSLFKYVPTCKLLFRRPEVIRAQDANAAHRLGLEIALQVALRVSDSSYGLFRVLKVGLRLALRHTFGFDGASEEEKNQIICSGLYSKAAWIVTGTHLAPELFRDDIPVTPAALACATTLGTLEMKWSKLEA